MEGYLGEIRIFPYNRIPHGWMACNGQALARNPNMALFALLAYTYGGENDNFNLPNLNGRVIVGTGIGNTGTAYQIGTAGGKEKEVLTPANLPPHTHPINVCDTYDTVTPNTNFLGNPNVASGTATNLANINRYKTSSGASSLVPLNSKSVTDTGASAAHENRMPFLTLTYCICTRGGVFPQRDY